jgi:hypothetical protein
MKRTVLLISILALASAAPAAAKGPAEAIITGPALEEPIALRWMLGDPSTPLGELADGAGFFEAAFGQAPDQMLADRPNGDLGPRYTIAYGGLGLYPDKQIRQELYPYAAAGPVTYMKPGQLLYGRTTAGGWYRAPVSLKDTLVSMGLPRSAPEASRSGSRSAWIVAPIAALLLAAVPLARRRRS